MLLWYMYSAYLSAIYILRSTLLHTVLTVKQETFYRSTSDEVPGSSGTFQVFFYWHSRIENTRGAENV
jgi:hypothetical protein